MTPQQHKEIHEGAQAQFVVDGFEQMNLYLREEYADYQPGKVVEIQREHYLADPVGTKYVVKRFLAMPMSDRISIVIEGWPAKKDGTPMKSRQLKRVSIKLL